MAEVDLNPVGVVFVDGCVEFELGSGFDGRQPELHGHGAEVPMFCPFCIFDTDLDIYQRMVQYVASLSFSPLFLIEHQVDQRPRISRTLMGAHARAAGRRV